MLDIDIEIASLEELAAIENREKKADRESKKKTIKVFFASALLLATLRGGWVLAKDQRVRIPFTKVGIEKVYEGTKNYISSTGINKSEPKVINSFDHDEMTYYSNWRKQSNGEEDYREIETIRLDDEQVNKEEHYNALIKKDSKLGEIFKMQGGNVWVDKIFKNDPNQESEIYSLPEDSYTITYFEKNDSGKWAKIDNVDNIRSLYFGDAFEMFFIIMLSMFPVIIVATFDVSKRIDKGDMLLSKQRAQIRKRLRNQK